MPTVRWLAPALDDLERLKDFLVAKDPSAGLAAIRRIRDGAAQLTQFPRIGRPMRNDEERRELILPFGHGAYVLRYRLDREKDAVIIIRVWHSREWRG